MHSLVLRSHTKLQQIPANRTDADLLVLVLGRGKVATPMRTRYDHTGKQMARAIGQLWGGCETDAEAFVHPRRIDFWFTPHGAPEMPEARREELGWYGRILTGAVTLEFFHNTPSGHELAACLFKHGDFRHSLSLRKPPPPLPTQWVISSGRPVGGIEGLGFRPMLGWPSGFYESPPLLWTKLVVVNELPVARNTLLLRLLGADSVLREAIAELQALPAESPERVLMMPILLESRLAVPTDPAMQTSDDREFLMDTQEIVETWRREAIQEGVKQGLEQGVEQGERKLLLRQLRRRFGNQVDGAIEQRVAAASTEQLEVWAERVLSVATLTELLAG